MSSEEDEDHILITVSEKGFQTAQIRMQYYTDKKEWIATIGWEGKEESRVITRTIRGVPRDKHSPLSILLSTLLDMDEDDLQDAQDISTDMARRQRGTVSKIQALASQLHNYRPPVRGGQSE